MRVTKLVIGILMIVLSVWLFLDGLLGQLLGIYATKSIVGGILEIIIAGLFIGAGIVYICLEKVLLRWRYNRPNFDDYRRRSRNIWWFYICLDVFVCGYCISNRIWILHLASYNWY